MGKVSGSNPDGCTFAAAVSEIFAKPAKLQALTAPAAAPMDMNSQMEAIQYKMKHVDELLTKLESREAPSIVALLQREIEELRALSAQFQQLRDGKKVVRKEERNSKMRYYLKDGSVYVVKSNEYRYLYDARTKVVTYEFENGQVERTFESGLKEIRQQDGSIVVKNGAKDYEYLG